MVCLAVILAPRVEMPHDFATRRAVNDGARRLDVDLIFYDTTTAYFEIDDPDEDEQDFAGRLYASLRRRGHSKEGRDNQPQVIIALAVTRDGMPVRSWVLPGDTADVVTVARTKQDLCAWRLGTLPVRR